jgi:hypothetical protein
MAMCIPSPATKYRVSAAGAGALALTFCAVIATGATAALQGGAAPLEAVVRQWPFVVVAGGLGVVAWWCLDRAGRAEPEGGAA